MIDERLPGRTRTSRSRPTGRCRIPTTTSHVYRRPVPALLARDRRRSGGGDRHRDRLHVLHDAPDARPTARRSAGSTTSRREPHAWVKLWKHHAAQPEADLINAVAAERGEPWLERYGGKISSEWFIAKSLQILREAPEVYARADRLIEAADWVVWQLTGVETRNSCTAGYKAMWSKRDGFPGERLLRGARSRASSTSIDEKMSRDIVPLGTRAGGLSAQAAAWTGLRPGRRSPSRTSTPTPRRPRRRSPSRGRWSRSWARASATSCSAASRRWSRGCAASSRTASCPGSSGSRPANRPWATSSPGSSSAASRPSTTTRRERRGLGGARLSRGRRRRSLEPGESGLLALDWWNGNRSVLVDADLGGLLRRHDARRRARPSSTGR